MRELLSMFYERLLGPALSPLLFLCGGILLIRLRAFFLLHPLRTARQLVADIKKSGGAPFRALALALAGTLGVGNITGVALAISTGGPGALFWMLISALAAMTLKYAEVVLALDSRRPDRNGNLRGGAMYYMRRGAPLFAFLCLLAAFSVGALIQGDAAAGCIRAFAPLPPVVFPLLFFCIAMPAIAGGRRRISAITAALIPPLTLCYTLLCVGILIVCHDRLPDVIHSIWIGAFTPTAAGGGIAGFLTMRCIRAGVSKGLLSNEAGCGTAPLAHAALSAGVSAAGQGLLGILEVFVDTVLLCTLTGLSLLVTGAAAGTGGPVDTVFSAFGSVYGSAGQYAVAVCIVLFAFGTVLSWAFYGEQALAWLSESTGAQQAYRVCFAVCFALGACAGTEAVFLIADILLGLMTLINLCAVMKNADRVVTLSAQTELVRTVGRGTAEHRRRPKAGSDYPAPPAPKPVRSEMQSPLPQSADIPPNRK